MGSGGQIRSSRDDSSTSGRTRIRPPWREDQGLSNNLGGRCVADGNKGIVACLSERDNALVSAWLCPSRLMPKHSTNERQ